MSATASTASTTASAIATATATAAASPKYSLVYRGNAIDGWIATFIAYTALKEKSIASITFYPISAGREVTNKQIISWVGSHVLFLDLSVSAETEKRMAAAGVLSTETMDYRLDEAKLCSSRLVWRKWYAHQDEPFWLTAVDRISRWDQPTFEDRCLREVLTKVSHMPPTDAVRATETLMTWMTTPYCAEFQSLMAQGHVSLSEKDAHLMAILCLGHVHDIREEDAVLWGLTPEWVGLRVFLLENSDTVIDTNEAAYLVFGHFQDVAAFINYRKKVRRDLTGNLGLIYLYSARSRGFDLTSGGFFQGQKQSAGAQRIIQNESPLPFVTAMKAVDAVEAV